MPPGIATEFISDGEAYGLECESVAGIFESVFAKPRSWRLEIQNERHSKRSTRKVPRTKVRALTEMLMTDDGLMPPLQILYRPPL